MTRNKYCYQGISLSVGLISTVKKHIKNKPEYSGVTDFVRQAIREKMERGLQK